MDLNILLLDDNSTFYEDLVNIFIQNNILFRIFRTKFPKSDELIEIEGTGRDIINLDYKIVFPSDVDNAELCKKIADYHVLLVDYSWSGDTDHSGNFFLKRIHEQRTVIGKAHFITHTVLEAAEQIDGVPIIPKNDRSVMIGKLQKLIDSFCFGPTYSPPLGNLINKIVLRSGFDRLCHIRKTFFYWKRFQNGPDQGKICNVNGMQTVTEHAIDVFKYFENVQKNKAFIKYNFSELIEYMENHKADGDNINIYRNFRDTLFYRLNSNELIFNVDSPIFPKGKSQKVIPSYIEHNIPNPHLTYKSYFPKLLGESFSTANFSHDVLLNANEHPIDVFESSFLMDDNPFGLLIISHTGNGYKNLLQVQSTKDALKNFVPFSNVFVLTKENSSISSVGYELCPKYDVDGKLTDTDWRQLPDSKVIFGINGSHFLCFKAGSGTAYIFLFKSVIQHSDPRVDGDL